MRSSSAVVIADDTDNGLLDVAQVPFHVLLAEQGKTVAAVRDGVAQQWSDPKQRDKLTVSAFASAL